MNGGTCLVTRALAGPSTSSTSRAQAWPSLASHCGRSLSSDCDTALHTCTDRSGHFSGTLDAHVLVSFLVSAGRLPDFDTLARIHYCSS